MPYLGGNLGSLGEEHSRHEGERRKVLTDANHCLLLPTERLTVLQGGLKREEAWGEEEGSEDIARRGRGESFPLYKD